MKKLITLLLALALLVPAFPAANAAVTEKPFQGVTWSNPIEGYSNVENLYNITISMQPGKDDSTVASFGSLVYGKYTDAQVTSMAEKMKKDMNARPEGQRYIHFMGPSKAMELVEKEVYLDVVVEQLSEMANALFAKYKEIGGKVEGAMMSMLYTGMGAHYINQSLAKDNKLLGKIVKDPRYQTQIRPLLEERGFVFYEGPLTDYTPEIYGITGKAGSKYSTCQSIWNTVMKNRLNESIRLWAYEPMAKYFPDVHVSDYQSTDTDARMKPVSTDGGVMGSSSGDGYRAGNTSSDKYYSNTPTDDEFYGKIGLSYKNIPTYMGTTYKKTSFNSFKFDMNTAKQAYWADSENTVSFWINRFLTSADKNTQVGNSPYYAEQLFHLCLHDPKPFVVFISTEDVKGDALQKAAATANELLIEVSRLAGYSDRKPIGLPVDWNSEFVLSGMYANGKNVWRISPNRDLTTKEAFQVAGKDPTFYIAGQTVTFPGGEIIADSNLETGTMGYWVKTDKNVMPVITPDADRFVKYPAYIEDYESYADGTKLQSTNLRDLNGWTVQPKGNDLLVVKNGKSQGLSITGNSLLENKLIPANVTVGDEYAKKQAWEVTITVPDGINDDAQMVILNYEANTEFDDGGFLLKGNKLYYATGELNEDDEPVYQELMDAKAGTYTLRRDMYFGQTFCCDYTVTDAKGKVLKTAEKVAIPTFEGKVKNIGITCDEMNQRVILDNYILRATSAAADLYLYDAALGLKLDKEAKQTKSASYRLSWANASQQKETATVKADITSGGKTTTKTLQTVTLNPGCDGVEYGTVELKSGETAKIYVESSIKDEKVELNPTEPTDAPDTPEATDAPEETEDIKNPTKATKKPIKVTKETQEPTKETEEPTEATKKPTKQTQEPTKETQEPTKETQEPTKASRPSSDKVTRPVTQATKPDDEIPEDATTEDEIPEDEEPEDEKPTKEPTMATKKPTKATQEKPEIPETPDKPEEETTEDEEPIEETEESTKATQKPTKETQKPTKATKEPTKATRPSSDKVTRPVTQATKPDELDKPEEEKPDDEIPEDEEPEDEKPEDEEPEDEEPEDEEPEEEATEDATTEDEIPEDEAPEEEATEDVTAEDDVPEEDATEDATAETETPEEDATEDATTEDEIPEQTEAPEQTEDATQATDTPDVGGKKSGVNVGLIIAGIVVVLAGAGAACWYFFIYKKTAAAPEATEENTEE